MRLRHSASFRGRVRNPLLQRGDDVSTTFDGVKFSDPIAALLDQAQTQGFRIEADPGKQRGGSAVVVYSPDKTVAPVRVGERGEVGVRHVGNVRRSLTAAGMVPLPNMHDDEQAPEQAPEQATPEHDIEETTMKLSSSAREFQKTIDSIKEDPEARMDLLAGLIYELACASGLEPELARVAGIGSASLISAMFLLPQQYDGAALELAEAAETRATEATKALERSDVALAKTRAAVSRLGTENVELTKQLGQAQEKVRATEAALAPLRALLGSTG